MYARPMSPPGLPHHGPARIRSGGYTQNVECRITNAAPAGAAEQWTGHFSCDMVVAPGPGELVLPNGEAYDAIISGGVPGATPNTTARTAGTITLLSVEPHR